MATRKMVRYALVATALVPVFAGKETQKASENPKGPKNGDDVKPPKEVVETVEACWGEGLDENQFALQGEPDEICDDPSKAPQVVDDGYEPSIFGGEPEHLDGHPKESKNDGEIW